ncbi:MAG: autotransporter domain-containing protein [Cycloclasticus sp.]|nr:autotransporter domain-containing protein [Cycloclasticus sp.]
MLSNKFNLLLKAALSFVINLCFIAIAYAIPAPTGASFTIAEGEEVTLLQNLADNHTGTIEVGGQLNTAGNAINASGVNNVISNSGGISTTGNYAYSIFSTGQETTITNSGSITTEGSRAHGIWSIGDDAAISNSGGISTTRNFAYGIYSTGQETTISNSGSISATGDFTYGIFSISDDAAISNSGGITTIGKGADGIFSSGANAIIINNGDISTAGDMGRRPIAGILTRGADAVISNSGSISTTGLTAYGIRSIGAEATITNSGDITTIGATSVGIFSGQSGAAIINSGGISTAGYGAHGIRSIGAEATITNSGSGSTTGEGASGIVSEGENASITNSGSISTIGPEAHGIYSSGSNATINISGLISATAANAILGSSNNSSLNLLAGSKIIGAIDLGSAADNDTANVYGGSASANLTFLNTEVINLFGAGVVVDNTVMTVDATAESSRSVILSGLTSSVHNVVSQRMAQAKALKPVQVASLELAPGMLFQERAPAAWAQVFGGQFDRNGDSSSFGYETDHEGFAAGYEWDNYKTRVGLMGGVAQSDTKSDISSFQTDVNSYFVGAYGHFNLGSVNLTASVLTGYADHDNERLVVDNINGLEVARSDVSSTFLSPSLTLSSAFSASDTFELRPSATISYSVAWMDDYKEKGTTSSNLSVGDRTLETLSARLQLAAAYQLNQASELELRIGVNSRDSNDDNTHASISGNGFSYSSVGDDSVTGGFAGANIRLAGMDNLSFVADVEYGESSDEDSLTGSLSLNYTF